MKSARDRIRAMFAEPAPEYGSPEEQECAEAFARLHAAYRALDDEIGPESATESVPLDDVGDVSGGLDPTGASDDHWAVERNDFKAQPHRNSNVAER